MTSVTIRILDGMEKGRVYSRLKLPVSVGREDENTIQLNDDRISRFHAKIQDSSGRVILTDLASTNGTRVNGHWIQMRILQIGDVISVGRCVLLLAGKQEDEKPAPTDDPDPFRTAYVKGGVTTEDDSKHLDFIEPLPGVTEEPMDLFPNGQPELPSELNSLQHIQLSDLLSYIHERVGLIVKDGKEEADATNQKTFKIDWETWAKLVTLHSKLSGYLSAINTTER